MDTTNSSENKQRRLEDHTPAATIDWSKPGAPAVPLEASARAERVLGEQELNWLADQFASVADVDRDAELRAGGPKRLIAFDYFKRGYMLAGGAHSAPQASPAATSGDAPTDLQQLKALALAATPGPWAYQEDSDAYTHIVRPVASPGWIIASATQTSKPEGEANGRWIAAANPAVVLDLIARIERAAAPAPTGDTWISIEDREPPEGVEVLVCGERNDYDALYQAVAMRAGSEYVDSDKDVEAVFSNVKYWSPLLPMPGVRAAAPATASGDELPEPLGWCLPVGPYSKLYPTIEWSPLNPWKAEAGAFPLYSGDQLRAAVSAATKPESAPQLVSNPGCLVEFQKEVERRSDAATKPTADLSIDTPEFRKLAHDMMTAFDRLDGFSGKRFIDYINCWGQSLLATKPAMRPTDDHLWDETIRDRDTYHEWADKLAEAISKHFDAYIGEHSNTNCPWAEALEAIEAATKPAAVPEGWKLVPVEPSIAMCIHGAEKLSGNDGRAMASVYRAMIHAAPSATPAAQDQAEFPHDFRKWNLKREDYDPKTRKPKVKVEADQAHVVPPFAAPASQHGTGFRGTISAGEYDRDTGMMYVTVKLPFKGLPEELLTINGPAMIATVSESAASGFREGRNTPAESSGLATPAASSDAAITAEHVRNEALEEAARECDVRASNWATFEREPDLLERAAAATILAQGIRYLKSAATKTTEGAGNV